MAEVDIWSSVQETLSTVFTTYPYSIFAWGAVAGSVLYLVRLYIRGGVCPSKALLNGKTAIITGGNTGIGFETAVDLAQRNARVILACRSKEKGETAVEKIKKRSGNQNVVFAKLDLASFESVRGFSAKILDSEPRLDILVNNAGVVFSSLAKTVDGFEMHFGVNHLGLFLLTNLLLDRIKEAPSGRIVNVSSLAYKTGTINFDDLNWDKRSFGAVGAYSQSKLASIIFTRSLSKRLQGSRATVNSARPGMVRTEVDRNLSFWQLLFMKPASYLFFKSPFYGAQTSIYCAVAEEMEGVSGQLLAYCKIEKLTNPEASDDNIAERLWDVSSQMVGL